MKTTTLAALLGALVFTRIDASAQSNAELLKRVDSVYANAKMYADSGSVDVVSTMSIGTRTSSKPFTTYFVRPDQFRFQYFDRSMNRDLTNIVWRGEGTTQGWAEIYSPPLITNRSFTMLVSGAMGVSGGSAATVPVLLMPTDFQGYPTITSRFANAIRLDDSPCSGGVCARLRSASVRNVTSVGEVTDTTTLWIDKASYLIRRVDSKRIFPMSRSEETTMYYPTINKPFADSLLKFRPPNRWARAQSNKEDDRLRDSHMARETGIEKRPRRHGALRNRREEGVRCFCS